MAVLLQARRAQEGCVFLSPVRLAVLALYPVLISSAHGESAHVQRVPMFTIQHHHLLQNLKTLNAQEWFPKLTMNDFIISDLTSRATW